MPPFLPIPEKPQHGAGKFENNNAFAGLAGLRFSWETALGWFIPRLGVKLGQVPGAKGTSGGLDPAATAALFATGTEAVLGQIGKGLTATQVGVADEHTTYAAVLDGIGAAIAQGASDTLAVKKHVQRRTAPKVIVRIVKPDVKALVAPYAQRTAAAEAKAAAAVRKAAALEVRLAKVEREQAKLSSTAVGDLPGRIGLIDHDLAGVKGQIKKLGKWATIGGFLLLLAKALEKMGAGWIRCSNVKQYGRALCGMNRGLLDALLLDTVLIVSALSLRSLVTEVLAVEDQIVAGIKRSVRELHGIDAIKEGGYSGTADGRT